MLPLRLTLENFMPYRGRQPPLVLEGLGVACLAGENGAGKSSLLDAITWALWGRSRAGDADDPLVSAGESEMAVELEFRAGEGRYRVLRRHRRPHGKARSGQTALELHAWDGAAYRALSGTSARETQRQLTELLRLDYDTFIRTAYLKQGEADLFTKERPAERKRLLGEILDLSLYERLAERARNEAREREARRRAAELAGETLDQELSGEDALRTELASREGALRDLAPQAAAAEAEAQRLQEEAARLGQGEAELERLREESARLDEEGARLEARRGALAARIADGEAVLARRAEIETGHAALEAARAALSAHGERARRFALLSDRRRRLEQAIGTARAALEREAAGAEAEARTLRQTAARSPTLAAQRAEATTRRGALDRARDAHEASRARLQALAGEIQARRARMAGLSEDREELKRRLGLLGAGAEGRCPLCGSDLGAHGLAQVRDHYRQREEEMAAHFAALGNEAEDRRKEHSRLEAEAQREERRLRQEMTATDDLLGRLRAEEERATQAARDLVGAEARLARLQARLKAGDDAPAERAALAALEAEAAALAYDPAGHHDASARVAGLEVWEGERRRLATALATLPQDQAALADVDARMAQAGAERAGKAARMAALGEATQRLRVVQGRLEAARRQAATLRERAEAEERLVTRLRLRMEELGRRREERRLRAEETRRAAEERAIYEELADGFGARGAQALLIETALPELEEEANSLLARITDNRMHVRLDTQRVTREGKQQETLEVLIGDEWGTRPYELYSGGEAFRIDFALRIGLSKLLARRAGAQVPLLFIDEGFGALDTSGRDRLVEAIAALRQDAAFRDGLILVITHLDDIKEQFDTRIEVAKTERGATFTVVGG